MREALTEKHLLQVWKIYLTLDITKFTFQWSKGYQLLWAQGGIFVLETSRQNCTFFWCCPRATFRLVAEQTVIFNGNRELC